MSALNRPVGEQGYARVKELGSDVDRWYYEGFYEQVFFNGGRVELRYKELMRLKLSVIHGCFT